MRSMKVSGVTTSHLIRQYEIESSRRGRSIGELDCTVIWEDSPPISFRFRFLGSEYSNQDFITSINRAVFDTCTFYIPLYGFIRIFLFTEIYQYDSKWNFISMNFDPTWLLVGLAAIVTLCSLVNQFNCANTILVHLVGRDDLPVPLRNRSRSLIHSASSCTSLAGEQQLANSSTMLH